MRRRGWILAILVAAQACDRAPGPPQQNGPSAKNTETPPIAKETDPSYSPPQDPPHTKPQPIRYPGQVTVAPQDHQDPKRYHFRPTARDDVDSDGRPLVVCEGTTDAPDGTRVGVHVYRGMVDLGNHLMMNSARVEKGKFACPFQIFPESNLPGTYAIDLTFSPEDQDLDVDEQIRRDDKARDVKVNFIWRLGTREDFDRELKRCRFRLAGEMDQMQKLLEAALDASAPLAEQANAIKEKLREIDSRNYQAPEYKFFGLAGIAQTEFEPLRMRGEYLIDCLVQNQPDKAKEALESFKRAKRDLNVRMGVSKATDVEIEGTFQLIRTQMDGLLRDYKDLYTGAPVKEGMDLVVKSHRLQIEIWIRQIAHSVPTEVYYQVFAFSEIVKTFYDKALEFSADRKKDRSRQLEELLEDCDKRIVSIKAMLRE